MLPRQAWRGIYFVVSIYLKSIVQVSSWARRVGIELGESPISNPTPTTVCGERNAGKPQNASKIAPELNNNGIGACQKKVISPMFSPTTEQSLNS
jgi:hypothetical protein